MGAFESNETPNDYRTKDSIVSDDNAKTEPSIDSSITPEISIVESDLDSEQVFQIMSSSKSVQLVDPFKQAETIPSKKGTSE